MGPARKVAYRRNETGSAAATLQLSPSGWSEWDHGDLRTMTKTSPLRATGAHVSVAAHITVDELRRYPDRTEIANGLANRFLLCCAQRSKVLPFGGGVVDWGDVPDRIAAAGRGRAPSRRWSRWTKRRARSGRSSIRICRRAGAACSARRRGGPRRRWSAWPRPTRCSTRPTSSGWCPCGPRSRSGTTAKPRPATCSATPRATRWPTASWRRSARRAGR
jgi:hypothetical protein